MFDRDVAAEMSDEELISALTAATRTEARAAAERLALVAEVTARQCEDEDDVTAHSVIDGWAYAKAQVSAACNLSPRAANTQMNIAIALRDRLPKTAALFATGAVSAKIISDITWRTKLVTDPDALALIDAGIAGDATRFGALSDSALIRAVDLWVETFDPIAVIQSKVTSRDVYVDFDDRHDPHGVASFWGRLRVTDKEALKERLDNLAATVCADDPRTVRQRRADALGALGFVGPSLERLACQCGNPDCEGSGKDPRSTAVTIYMVTGQEPGEGARPAPETGPTSQPGPGTPPCPEPDAAAPDSEPAADPAAQNPEPEPAPDARPAAQTRPPAGIGAGITLDGAIIPAALLADLIATGAKVRPLADLANLGTERPYRPSTKLTAFVRMSAQTCSFPGCNKPAHRCDLDHVMPWPAGATHPGNLRPLCREHHLLKTFRIGPDGWTMTAQPDGRTQWTSPTGHSYVTTPGAAILFPHWNIHTDVPPPRHISLIHDDQRYARMPTRAQDREYRINTERTRNATQLALAHAATNQSAPPTYFDQTGTTITDPDPPPF